MMVAAANSGAASNETPQGRPPLLPSERENGGVGPKRPKSKQVSSRYMSPSPSPSNPPSISSTSSLPRRCASPLVSRNSTSGLNTPAAQATKRSVSVDRSRPGASRTLAADLVAKQGNVGDVSAATKLLVTSTRSLSVSFQGESFSLPVSKTKAAPATPTLSNGRKVTPEKRRSSTPSRVKVDSGRDQVENSKPGDQYRWPGRSRQPNPLSRSLDCSQEEKKKVIGSANVIKALQKSMIDDTRRASFDGRLSLDLGSAESLKSVERKPDRHLEYESSVPSDLAQSDTDSVSSGSSTSGPHECGRKARGIAVSARFWQETNSRLRRLQDPGTPLSNSPGRTMVPPRFPQPKKFPTDSPMSSPRTMASPVKGGMIRPASPSKLMTPRGSSSPSRGMQSPSRVRSSVAAIISSNSETPSVLSFAVDAKRGKVGENRIVDAHVLRLLYNRQLQWRFVNARTESSLSVQKHKAEKNLWNAWITISNLRDSVTKKRHRLQLLKQKLKLASILKRQMLCLEDWSYLDNDHTVSLLGAIESLEASTLRLPVLGGAIADVQGVKDAIGSAVDVMHAMTSSICLLLSKVEEVNVLVAELAKINTKERASLEQCKDFLSILASMQVKHCSLRTHILQLNRLRRP